eukprot:COSAG01_NODE_430_length_17153_cov_24.866717_22_plen_42_part_00
MCVMLNYILYFYVCTRLLVCLVILALLWCSSSAASKLEKGV